MTPIRAFETRDDYPSIMVLQSWKSAPKSLLLLTSQPEPPSFANLRAAYGQALSTALSSVAAEPNSTTGAAILEIALPYPDLEKYKSSPRSQLYAPCQRLLAGIYRLICVICATESLEIQGPGGVDARVLLLRIDEQGQTTEGMKSNLSFQGPICDLWTLATSSRDWIIIFSLEGKEGDALLNQFLGLVERLSWRRNLKVDYRRLKTERTSLSEDDHEAFTGSIHEPKRHMKVAVGGTFDHLHAGHKLLLTMSLFLVEPGNISGFKDRKLIVGISADELLQKKKFSEYLQNWDERQKHVADFVQSLIEFTEPGGLSRGTQTTVNEAKEKVVVMHSPSGFSLECAQLWDPYGPTIADEAISALVVSAETRQGGDDVNEKRREKGWNTLDIFEVDVLDVHDEDDRGRKQDFGSKISSTEIRRRLSEKNTIGAGTE